MHLNALPAKCRPQIAVGNYFSARSTGRGSDAKLSPFRIYSIHFLFPQSVASKAVKSSVCMLSKRDLPSKHHQSKQREDELGAGDWKNNESILLFQVLGKAREPLRLCCVCLNEMTAEKTRCA